MDEVVRCERNQQVVTKLGVESLASVNLSTSVTSDNARSGEVDCNMKFDVVGKSSTHSEHQITSNAAPVSKSEFGYDFMESKGSSQSFVLNPNLEAGTDDLQALDVTNCMIQSHTERGIAELASFCLIPKEPSSVSDMKCTAGDVTDSECDVGTSVSGEISILSIVMNNKTKTSSQKWTEHVGSSVTNPCYVANGSCTNSVRSCANSVRTHPRPVRNCASPASNETLRLKRNKQSPNESHTHCHNQEEARQLQPRQLSAHSTRHQIRSLTKNEHGNGTTLQVTVGRRRRFGEHIKNEALKQSDSSTMGNGREGDCLLSGSFKNVHAVIPQVEEDGNSSAVLSDGVLISTGQQGDLMSQTQTSSATSGVLFGNHLGSPASVTKTDFLMQGPGQMESKNLWAPPCMKPTREQCPATYATPRHRKVQEEREEEEEAPAVISKGLSFNNCLDSVTVTKIHPTSVTKTHPASVTKTHPASITKTHPLAQIHVTESGQTTAVKLTPCSSAHVSKGGKLLLNPCRQNHAMDSWQNRAASPGSQCKVVTRYVFINKPLARRSGKKHFGVLCRQTFRHYHGARGQKKRKQKKMRQKKSVVKETTKRKESKSGIVLPRNSHRAVTVHTGNDFRSQNTEAQNTESDLGNQSRETQNKDDLKNQSREAKNEDDDFKKHSKETEGKENDFRNKTRRAENVEGDLRSPNVDNQSNEGSSLKHQFGKAGNEDDNHRSKIREAEMNKECDLRAARNKSRDERRLARELKKDLNKNFNEKVTEKKKEVKMLRSGWKQKENKMAKACDRKLDISDRDRRKQIPQKFHNLEVKSPSLKVKESFEATSASVKHEQEIFGQSLLRIRKKKLDNVDEDNSEISDDKRKQKQRKICLDEASNKVPEEDVHTEIQDEDENDNVGRDVSSSLQQKSKMRNRKDLTLQEKVQAILALETPGAKLAAVATKFGVSVSAISRINKNKELIMLQAVSGDLNGAQRRSRECKDPELDKVLLKWYRNIEYVHSQDTPVAISNVLLKEKAHELAVTMGKSYFPSDNWIIRWKHRHNIGVRSSDTTLIITGREELKQLDSQIDLSEVLHDLGKQDVKLNSVKQENLAKPIKKPEEMFICEHCGILTSNKKKKKNSHLHGCPAAAVRKDLTLEEKVQVVQALEQPGVKMVMLAKKYGVSASAISRIHKNRVDILARQASGLANAARRRDRGSKEPEVEKVLCEWFKVQHELGIHISGSMIRDKARDIAKVMGKEFWPSESWVFRWRHRNNVTDVNTFLYGDSDESELGGLERNNDNAEDVNMANSNEEILIDKSTQEDDAVSPAVEMTQLVNGKGTIPINVSTVAKQFRLSRSVMCEKCGYVSCRVKNNRIKSLRHAKGCPDLKPRNELTYENRARMLKALEEPGATLSSVARQFGVSVSSMSRMNQKKDQILLHSEDHASQKRIRDCKEPEVAYRLYQWYMQKKAEGIHVTGPKLKEKAKRIAAELGREFSASSGWLGRWRHRYNIISNIRHADSIPKEAIKRKKMRRGDDESKIDTSSEELAQLQVIPHEFHQNSVSSTGSVVVDSLEPGPAPQLPHTTPVFIHQRFQNPWDYAQQQADPCVWNTAGTSVLDEGTVSLAYTYTDPVSKPVFHNMFDSFSAVGYQVALPLDPGVVVSREYLKSDSSEEKCGPSESLLSQASSAPGQLPQHLTSSLAVQHHLQPHIQITHLQALSHPQPHSQPPQVQPHLQMSQVQPHPQPSQHQPHPHTSQSQPHTQSHSHPHTQSSQSQPDPQSSQSQPHPQPPMPQLHPQSSQPQLHPQSSQPQPHPQSSQSQPHPQPSQVQPHPQVSMPLSPASPASLDSDADQQRQVMEALKIMNTFARKNSLGDQVQAALRTIEMSMKHTARTSSARHTYTSI